MIVDCSHIVMVRRDLVFQRTFFVPVPTTTGYLTVEQRILGGGEVLRTEQTMWVSFAL